MAPTGTQRETGVSDSIGAHGAHNPERTKYNRSSSDTISYEDLLVAQYLEGLKKAEATGSRRRLTRPSKPASPYMQKLARSDQPALTTTTSAMQAFPRTRSGTGRPYSAAPAGCSSARERRRIDVKFMVDGGEEEGEEPRERRKEGDRTRSRLRPMSAPVYKTKRPWSGKSASSTATASQRSRRGKALYRQQPQVIRATVYKNGTQTDAARVTAHSMKTFLEACTIKLSLQFAARRIFLSDGTEVKYPEEIPKDTEVFISCGEPYRDPTSNVKGDAHKKLYANWTMNGVVLPAETKKKKKSTLSKRMRKMLESKMRRVMIFRNGDGTEVFETTASAENFGRFLDDCTSRLGLTAPARIIYSWTGSEVTDLNDVPLLDRCLQTSTTPLYGPVWISKGERFSPKGVKAFLETTIKHCKQKLQAANSYKKQLQYGLAGETQQVTLIEILSKTEHELEKELQETEEGINEFTEAKRKLQDILEEISESVMEEEGAGSTYTMKHIKEFDSSHRLVGQQGIRLKVYENGQGDGEETVFFNLKEASKGIGNDHNLLLQRLLDVMTRWARVEKNTTALSTVVTKIFDRDGKEITDVYSLKTDQEVWISFGEPFRDPNMYCLQLTFDKVQGLDLYGERNTAVREPLNSNDIPKGEERPSHWEATIGFPVIYDYEEVTYDLSKEVQDQKRLAVEKHELDITGHFLQNKDDPSKVLYCELALQPKKKQGSRDVWPPRSQTWVINKRGQIYCRSMPQLALAVIEKWRVDKQFADRETPAQGLAVGLEKRQQDNPYQQWVFSEDGYIYATAEQDLVLTYIEPKPQDDEAVAMEMMLSFGQQQQEPDQQAQSNASDPYGEDPDFESNGEENAEKKDEPKTEKDPHPGQVYAVAVIPQLPARHPWAKAQRWALKQERLDNLGQWKHTKAQNPLWNKLAYSWPVNSQGQWNEDFDWPMEGYFIPYAPPIKKMTRKLSASEAEANFSGEQKESPVRTVPLRLRVLKNGERDVHRQAFVVGPDLTNMMRDLNRTAMNGKRPHRRSQSREKSLEQLEQEMVQKRQTKKDELKTLEFQLFLDRCTALLNLPFAARRLFDQEGQEHDTLDRLQRDQLVFVSCGETWNDPTLSSQDQQRRTILAMLAADVNAMKQYCALRSPMNLVLEVEGPLAAGSPLVVNPIAVSPEERQHLLRGPTPEAEQEEEGETDGDMYANLSAHERAHIASDQRAEGLKWPWERVLNVSLDQVMEVNQGSTSDEAAFSNADLYKKFKPKQSKSPSSTRLSHQRFIFADGFLAVQTAPYLVVGLQQPELELSRVLLCKKSTEDASQRWEADTQGFIRSKLNPDLVLGAQMPSAASDDDGTAPSSSFCGQPITLQHQRMVRYGTANQKWSFEKETGFVDAFAADIQDKEITAANKASVCTFAVCAETPLEQMGFVVTGTKSAEPVIVCAACARFMRANHRLRKLEEATEFVCAVGLAPKRNVKMTGCFQCLNGKVDLSTFEASNTITQYEKELKRLRQMSSARVIAREISAYQPVQMVKILAHRNGEGRSREGVVMNGSTVRGLLDQCTYNLQLSTAARRLYTQDGTLILTVADFIQWNLACYGMAGMDINEQEDEKDKTSDKWHDASADLKVSSVLRIPVEVWVSCGEQFVRPEHVDYKRKLLLQQREERAGVVLELEKEKHVLRQMQGRRTNGMEGPQYISTLSPDAPVMVDGGWTQPSRGEVKKSLVVHQLENHLQEVKGQQKQQQANHVTARPVIDGSKKLYSQPNLKRVKVYKNGESPDKHTLAWGSSLSEILQDGTTRLDMRKAAAQIYTADGQKVTDFEEIRRDQLLCLSHGDHFKGSKGSRNQVEVKANWSRARKRDGPQATDIMVTSNKHPAVRVDPFGPPSLALTASPTEEH